MTPLRLRPLFRDKVWAGGKLSRWLDGAPATAGEAWLVSDVAGEASEVTHGPHAGRTLRELVAAHPEQLLGTAELAQQRARGEEPRWPLLVKLLDIGPPLSVQLHPNGALARELGDGERGKCEAWLILEPGPQARIYAGVRPGAVTLDALLEACAAGQLGEEQLASYAPRPGEGLAITPGTLHTARDVVALEVQETSDVTYRVYDWGRGRELHLEQARRTLETLGLRPPPERDAGWEPGLRDLSPGCPFRFERWQLIAGQERTTTPDLPGVLIALGGQLAVRCGEASFTLRPGESLVLPAAGPPATVQAGGDVRCAYGCVRPQS